MAERLPGQYGEGFIVQHVAGLVDQAILAEWGVLEIDVNPFANFTAGITGIRAFYTCDVGVRIPGAFSVASSIT